MSKKKKHKPREQKAVQSEFILTPTAKKVMVVLFCLAVILGFFLRFYDLERKPLHHDEGVNAWFLLNLKKNFPAGWKYDPANYHGPFLFFTHIIPLTIKESIFSLRCGPALFGSLLILLLWPLRRKIGRAGVVAAGFLLALSPANLYFARTNIHETYLIFFTLAAVVAAVRFWESKRARYFVLMAASSALVITVKETYILTAGVFFWSLVFTYFWLNITREKSEPRPKIILRQLRAWLRGNSRVILLAALVFVFIIVIYYSSIFTNAKGTTSDLITTLKIWQETGTKGAGHEKPYWYFGEILIGKMYPGPLSKSFFSGLWYFTKTIFTKIGTGSENAFELPIFIFGIIGIFYAFKKRNALMVFSAFWAAGLFLAYSFVPYKTPWLSLNFILPLSLLAGYSIENVYRSISHSKLLVTLMGITSGAVLVVWFNSESWPVNFVYYDDDRFQLVYSQTRRDINDFMERLEDYAHEQAQGYDTEIKILSDEYWPLQWYLREYPHTAFWGKVTENPDAPIVIGRTTTQKELEKRLKDTYYSELYSLRPGLDLILYTRLHKGKLPEEELKGEEPLKLAAGKLKPGLVAKYYRKTSPIGKPDLVRVEDRIDFRYDSDEEKPIKSPFSIMWEGIIEITESGRYTFATESDDGSWVFIDDKMVVDNGGTHPIQYVSDTIFLNEGFHRIKIKYFDYAWGAVMKLLWAPPGQSTGPIPPKYLWHQE